MNRCPKPSSRGVNRGISVGAGETPRGPVHVALGRPPQGERDPVWYLLRAQGRRSSACWGAEKPLCGAESVPWRAPLAGGWLDREEGAGTLQEGTVLRSSPPTAPALASCPSWMPGAQRSLRLQPMAAFPRASPCSRDQARGAETPGAEPTTSLVADSQTWQHWLQRGRQRPTGMTC